MKWDINSLSDERIIDTRVILGFRVCILNYLSCSIKSQLPLRTLFDQRRRFGDAVKWGE